MQWRSPTTAAIRAATSRRTTAGAREGVALTASLQVLVGRQGEELRKLLRPDETVQNLRGLAEAADGRAPESGDFFAADSLVQRLSDRSPVGEPRVVANPLPELGPGDLGCRDVLHEVEDRCGAVAGEPGV